MPRRRSKEKWRQIVADQQSSGLTAAEYCRQHDINSKYFSTRKTQLNNGNFVRVNPNISQPCESAATFLKAVSKQPRIRIIDVELGDVLDTRALCSMLDQVLS